jgi:hypothetical protein
MSRVAQLKSLVRRALLKPRFDQFSGGNESDQVVTLDFELAQEDFRGLPSEWTAVLVEVSRFAPGESLNDLFELVRRTLATLNKRAISRAIHDRRPIVLLADGPEHALSDEFSQDRGVFSLSARELPILDQDALKLRIMPLTVAIRRRIPTANAIPQSLWPYHGMQPSVGWRFYARREQLNRLVESTDSFLLTGARRIGKTSLMRETERQLRASGRDVHFIDLQDAFSVGAVIEKIMDTVDHREAMQLRRRAHKFGEKPLDMLLRRFASNPHHAVLLLDELGNIAQELGSDTWKFLGTLRRFIHDGHLRVIASCYQEFSLAQQESIGTPHTNFAQELRLLAFTKDDVRDFAIGPWEFWNPVSIADQAKILDVALAEVGRHPLFLQAFGYGIFKELQLAGVGAGNADLYKAAATVARKKRLEYFDEAVEQVFYSIPSALVRYLYLRRCHEGRSRGEQLNQIMFDDPWLSTVLAELGFASTVQSRRNILVNIELHGLTEAAEHNRSTQIVITPVIYMYIEQIESKKGIEHLMQSLAADARNEQFKWRLAKSERHTGLTS